MRHLLLRFHNFAFFWRHLWSEEFIALFIAVFIIATLPASALGQRFLERTVFMNSTEPGVTTSYTLSLGFHTVAAVGSVDMLFCIDPIPYMPCVTPPGLDVSSAVLSDQTGETGFSISSQSTNHILLTRTPTVITSGVRSSYKFDNIVNPTDTNQAYSIRLQSHDTIDGTGSQIDFGSVRAAVSNSIQIETQVPPMLIFCLAGQVNDNCAGTNNNYYSDMGRLSSESTLTAQSQMAVGTNATAGFVITANGVPPTAGTSVIDAPSTPTPSVKGTNQFGMNLVANSEPFVGADPDGPFANAVTTPDYGVPNMYKYVDGDVVAYSPNVSLMKKYTVSYILNSSESLRPGVYSTTITYVASGRF